MNNKSYIPSPLCELSDSIFRKVVLVLASVFLVIIPAALAMTFGVPEQIVLPLIVVFVILLFLFGAIFLSRYGQVMAERFAELVDRLNIVDERTIRSYLKLPPALEVVINPENVFSETIEIFSGHWEDDSNRIELRENEEGAWVSWTTKRGTVSGLLIRNNQIDGLKFSTSKNTISRMIALGRLTSEENFTDEYEMVGEYIFEFPDAERRVTDFSDAEIGVNCLSISPVSNSPVSMRFPCQTRLFITVEYCCVFTGEGETLARIKRHRWSFHTTLATDL